jgi:hypothetical protein
VSVVPAAAILTDPEGLLIVWFPVVPPAVLVAAKVSFPEIPTLRTSAAALSENLRYEVELPKPRSILDPAVVPVSSSTPDGSAAPLPFNRSHAPALSTPAPDPPCIVTRPVEALFLTRVPLPEPIRVVNVVVAGKTWLSPRASASCPGSPNPIKFAVEAIKYPNICINLHHRREIDNKMRHYHDDSKLIRINHPYF